MSGSEESVATPRLGELFEEFVRVIARLRDPNGGCPWDLEQTHESIRPYLIEEAYEVLEAIDDKDDLEFAKELGDVLLQVVLHAQIARDRSAFAIDDVVRKITDKIVTRHPHVFGDVKANNPLEASKSWEKQKLKEQADKERDIFAGIPPVLPALIRAHRMGEKACHVGFDWRQIQDVFAKVEEELGELKHEIVVAGFEKNSAPVSATGSLDEKERKALEHEMGDLLFSSVQLARWLGLSPEDCLRSGCDRFRKRFTEMSREANQPLDQMSLDELDVAWESAKQRLGE